MPTYILNNFTPDNKNTPLTIEVNKDDKKTKLIHLSPELIQIGVETRPYCNYYTLKPNTNVLSGHTTNPSLSNDIMNNNNINIIIDNISCNLNIAKSFDFQTFRLINKYKNYNKSSINNKYDLGTIYGSKKVKKGFIIQEELKSISGLNNKSFININNMFPKYNTSFKSINDIYPLDLLFSTDFIKEMKESKRLSVHNILNNLFEIKGLSLVNESNKIEFKIINLFCHILSTIKPNSIQLPKTIKLPNSVQLPKTFDFLEFEKITEKTAFCVFIRFIILLLVMFNGRILIKDLPVFKFPIKKVNYIMKEIGCVSVGLEWVLIKHV
ncbi:hypothetical protein CDIK_1331 [Cucumispora dikerogammari]|nr:hypothetical protein CDIK_1331 [Cucumispora dikerogammari]